MLDLRRRASALPLDRHAFDLDQQAGMRKLAHADARPGACALGKQAILHVAKYGHVLRHVDVVGGHVNHVLKAATSGGQHAAQVLPGGDELLLRVLDYAQVGSATHLSGTEKRPSHSDSRCITRSSNDGFHGIWNDDFAVGHGAVLKHCSKAENLSVMAFCRPFG